MIDRRPQVLDPMTAYQITSMMEGVVLRGTAAGAGFQKEVGKPVAGKTGTTNDEKDAWFIGFTPDLVIGVYMGYDKPRHLGRGATGGHLSAPIVRDFMKVALADKPSVPFRVPPGIKLIRVDLKTGTRAGPGTERAILEAFKPGTAPPDGYSVVGMVPAKVDDRGVGVTPDADRAVRSGTADCTELRLNTKSPAVLCGAFVFSRYYAAFTLTLRSANVNLESADFPLRDSVAALAQSGRPSCFAQAIKVPWRVISVVLHGTLPRSAQRQGPPCLLHHQ